MKTILSMMAVLALALVVEAAAGADQRRIVGRQRAASGVAVFSGGGADRIIVQRHIHGAYPYYYYPPYHPPVFVVSPYAQSYILPPTVVVNAPYFCVLHNQGFVSRVGLLDHLAGTHKVPLEAATYLCPDGASCVFPSP